MLRAGAKLSSLAWAPAGPTLTRFVAPVWLLYTKMSGQGPTGDPQVLVSPATMSLAFDQKATIWPLALMEESWLSPLAWPPPMELLTRVTAPVWRSFR